MAYTLWSRVDKTDACTGSKQYFLNENSQGKQYFVYSSTNGYIIPNMEKGFSDVFTHIPLAIFQAVEATGVEQDKNNHNLSIAHMVVWCLVFYCIFFLLKIKFLAKNHLLYNKPL